MSNFDEFTRSRYAQMQSSIFNRTGSSIVSGGGNSKLNLTGKFGSIEQQVKHIEVETHALTQAGHESARVVEQMRRVVADKELNECQGKCVQEVKKYERVVSYGIAENDQRTEQLWQKCKSLSNSTEELKQSIARLHSKINKLQNVLGYYNGAEIVSNY